MTASTNPNPEQAAKPKSAARFVPVIARVLMGLAFTAFGLNAFVPFMGQGKAEMPQAAMDFAGAMMKTGYMFKLVGGTQLVAGVLLLFGLFVPLALILLMPVLVNIILFHVFLSPALGAFAPGIVLMVLELYLAWAYRDYYRPLFVVRAKPH
jgi:uncharacterized membrane protein YphA (DoxX/SURF4 family)